ncbi:MAG: hypothetical protein WCD46_17465 [Desulfobacterales bacterium]|jgi:hypothetical protein
MHNFLKTVTILAMVASLLTVPLGGAALAADKSQEDISASAMWADALIVRPLGLVSIVAGSALFLVSLPFSLTGGNVGETAHTMVVVPSKFTFDRPLGDLTQLEPRHDSAFDYGH